MTSTELLAYVSAAITWGIIGIVVGFVVGRRRRIR